MDDAKPERSPSCCMSVQSREPVGGPERRSSTRRGFSAITREWHLKSNPAQHHNLCRKLIPLPILASVDSIWNAHTAVIAQAGNETSGTASVEIDRREYNAYLPKYLA